MKKTLLILLVFPILLLGCRDSYENDKYISGEIIGDVLSIPNAMYDLGVNIYELPDTETVTGWYRSSSNRYFIIIRRGTWNQETISYLVVPTRESSNYISATLEVTFIPLTRVVTYGPGTSDDVLSGNDFNTTISY